MAKSVLAASARLSANGPERKDGNVGRSRFTVAIGDASCATTDTCFSSQGVGDVGCETAVLNAALLADQKSRKTTVQISVDYCFVLADLPSQLCGWRVW